MVLLHLLFIFVSYGYSFVLLILSLFFFNLIIVIINFGWMDGVKVALGNRGMTVVIFAWPCVLSDRPSVLWWLSLERVSLHDAVALGNRGMTVVIFAWPCVLSDRPPVFWWLSPGEDIVA